MWVFIASVFTSAGLMFLVQPMVTKMLLPMLGGSTAVWNVAMMCFQLMLLAGYGYVYLSTRYLTRRQQELVHMLLLLASGFFLPLMVQSLGIVFSPDAPLWWMVKVLVVGLAVPFLALAANAPLMQYWYTQTTLRGAQDPYFLYSASNLASFLALFAYLFLVEPFFGLAAQGEFWSLSYTGFIAVVVACVLVMRYHATHDGRARTHTQASTPVTGDARIWWVVLAAIPSSLMLGVTNYISTDLAAVPLLWVIPLALYLLTFVLAFRSRATNTPMIRVHLVLTCLVIAAMMVMERAMVLLMMAFHLVLFFVAARACHGQLANRKPEPAHLSEYYLWIALGGALGGVFNTLIAPLLFNNVWEYPLMLIAALAVMPRDKSVTRGKAERLIIGIVCIIMFLWFWWYHAYFQRYITFREEAISAWAKSFLGDDYIVFLFIFGLRLAVPFCLIWQCSKRFRRDALAMALILFCGITMDRLTLQASENELFSERNFYGVLRVINRDNDNFRRHVLIHGTTLHGVQLKQDGMDLVPSSYYAALSGLFKYFHETHPQPARMALVGLGTGSVVCYGRTQDDVDVFEINPLVAKVATDPNLFTFMQQCPPKRQILIGDGRMLFHNVPDEQYDVIILDAYSSDAIPFHLITKEAVELYVSKLKPDGLLIFHLSSMFFDLPPTVGAIMKELGIPGLLRVSKGEAVPMSAPSSWMVLSRSIDLLEGILKADPVWQGEVPIGDKVWTDQYYHIFDVLRIQ